MVPLTRKMLTRNRGRFAITIGGVALMVLLMLFLLGVHRGAARGATGYVRDTRADLWISTQSSTNLLRSSSFMKEATLASVNRVHSVREMTGLLRFISTGRINERAVTLFIFGYDPHSPLARPALAAGSSDLHSGEIAVDRAFAAKHHLVLGDSIRIQERSFVLRGLTQHTNALVTQFTFMTLEDAQLLLGFPGVVSFMLVALEKQANAAYVAEQIQQSHPGLSVFSRAAFVRNNLEEMESGILPILWTIALFGSLAGTAVLTLLLYSSVQEHRQDYALLSALGAPPPFLAKLVIKQSLLCGVLGFAVGLSIGLCGIPALKALVPTMELVITMDAIGSTLALSGGVGTLAGWASIGKLSRIYPGEVFAGQA